MIRSNVPLPLLYRLRMRANTAAHRAQSRLSSYRRRGTSGAGRAVWARKGAGRRVAECSPQLWSEFVDQYERFTSALCSAAKDGCSASTERDYTSARRWFARHYASVAPRVRPYLDVEFSGSSADRHGGVSVIVDYAGQRREIDALEALFQPVTLSDMLSQDSGDLIPQIARVSTAIYRCQTSLEAG